MTEEQLLNYTMAWDQAIADNDIDQMRSFMSDDWICIATNGGITSLDVFLDQVRKSQLVHTEMSTQESRVKIYGTTGVVTGKGYSKGTFRGKPFSFHEWSTSVFVFNGTKWQCVLTMLADADLDSCT